MESMLLDLRFSVRRLLRRPVFAAVILLSLALGIGINSSVFGLVNMTLLRPLPITDAERLVRIYTQRPNGAQFRAFSYPDYVDLRDGVDLFSGVVAERFTPIGLSTGGDAQLLWGELVSGNYFEVLGVRPALGRLLTPEDDRTPGGHPVAVLSYGLWRDDFGSDPEIIGREVLLSGRSFTVIGVAAEGFGGTFVGGKPEIWVPLMMQEVIMPVGDRLQQRGARWLTVTGRMADGASVQQVAARLDLFFSQLEEAHPTSNRGVRAQVVSFRDDTLPFQAKGRAGRASLLLLLVTGAVLLIACMNLVNILLAQASERQREISLRQAVGADRKRLLRQFVIEALMIAVIAAALALGLTMWASALISRIPLPGFLPLAINTGVDWRVIAYTLVLSLVVGVVLGLLPALRATRYSLVAPLKSGAQDRGEGKLQVRNVLVVAQVALSVVLLVGAGLFVRSLRNSLSVDPGFDADGVLVAATNLGLQGYEQGEAVQFYRQLLERLRAAPEVESASLAELLVLETGAEQQTSIEVPGYDVPPHQRLTVDYNLVASDYFTTMGIPILHGSDFEPVAPAGARPWAIVNQTLAERYWDREDVVGERMRIGGNLAEIVGVVADSKYGKVSEDPKPFAYLSMANVGATAMVIHVRTRTEPEQAIATVRHAVKALDPAVPIFNVRTMSEHLRVSLLPGRLAAALMTVFGLLALVLTAVGTYGVMTYFVIQRRREISIRMALGAQPSYLLPTVLGQGGILVAVGLVMGLVVAGGLSRFVTAMLYEVGGTDPAVFAGVAALLLAVAALSTFFPARRATRIDPMVVLRAE